MAITLKPGELHSFGSRGTWVNQSDDELKVGVPFGMNAGTVYGINGPIGYTVGIDPGAGDFTATRYRMRGEALSHFSNPDVQAWMRERVSERADVRFYIDINYGGTVIAQSWGAKEFCITRTSGKVCWWSASQEENEQAWKMAADDGRAYLNEHGQMVAPVTTAKQYQELFGKPAPVGMFGEMMRAIDGEDGGVYVLPPGVDVELIRWGKAEPDVLTIGSSIGVESKNCASCGDALHESYDPSRIVDGQRLHGTCADRVERLRAEQAPKVERADPYSGRMLGDERVIATVMRERDAGFVSRLKLDQPVSEYREKFGAHPWECDE